MQLDGPHEEQTTFPRLGDAVEYCLALARNPLVPAHAAGGQGAERQGQLPVYELVVELGERAGHPVREGGRSRRVYRDEGLPGLHRPAPLGQRGRSDEEDGEDQHSHVAWMRAAGWGIRLSGPWPKSGGRACFRQELLQLREKVLLAREAPGENQLQPGAHQCQIELWVRVTARSTSRVVLTSPRTETARPPTNANRFPRRRNSRAMCARASSGRRSLIAEQPLADAFLDLLVAFVRVAGAQSGALEADSGAHHLQRLAGLLLRAGAAGAFDLVATQRIHARILSSPRASRQKQYQARPTVGGLDSLCSDVESRRVQAARLTLPPGAGLALLVARGEPVLPF